MQTPYDVLAKAFCYPAPGRLADLRDGQALFPAGAAKNAFGAFLKKIAALSLGEWEELHTRTLDMNPPAAPYIGFQTWGESYQRGTFLALLNRELRDKEVELEGELPDHLVPVLRYLGIAPEPLPELASAFDPALQRMRAALAKADPANLYLDLLDAVQDFCNLGLKLKEES